MKRPPMRIVEGTRIDLAMSLIAETTLGIRSEVRDKDNRIWVALGSFGSDEILEWQTGAYCGRETLKSLADVVQIHGDVTVVRITESGWV